MARTKWTYKTVEEEIQKTRPHISLDHSTYKNTKIPARFIDSEHGEWWTQAHHLIRGGNHPKRSFQHLKITSQEVERRIQQGHGNIKPRPFISIKHETFKDISTHCTFLDEDFGEWEALPRLVMRKYYLHPKRVQFNKASKISAIKESLPNFISVDESTYISACKPARFLDSKYGEWWARPSDIVGGGKHPARAFGWKTSHQVEKEIQQDRPFISIRHDTFQGTTKHCIFKDDKFGDWRAVPCFVLRGNNHPKRYFDKLTLKLDEVQRRITEGYKRVPPRPYIKVDPETYVSANEKARFIDENFGEWWTYVYVVLNGSGHPHRSATSIEAKIIEEFKIGKFDKDIGLPGKLRPDFKINERLYLDVHGLYWHSSKKVRSTYHSNRRVAFEQAGLRLLQFWDFEVMNKPDVLKQIVFEAINKPTEVKNDNINFIKITKSAVENNALYSVNNGEKVGAVVKSKLVFGFEHRNGRVLNYFNFPGFNYHYRSILRRYFKRPFSVNHDLRFRASEASEVRQNWYWSDGIKLWSKFGKKGKYKVFDAGYFVELVGV